MAQSPDVMAEAPVVPGPVVVVSGPGGVGKSTTARRVAGSFPRGVHLSVDDLLAAVVSGAIDPALPEAEHQHEAIGGALAVSAMSLAGDGYATVVCGYLFPDGVAALADACAARGLDCHYAVLWADRATCWRRATGRSGEDLDPLPFTEVHDRFARLDVADRHVIDATGPPEAVSDAVLAALAAGTLVVRAGG